MQINERRILLGLLQLALAGFATAQHVLFRTCLPFPSLPAVCPPVLW